MKKCAFVTIIGRPSVGKSTLLNKMCGEKVAIVSKVPQTTRNAIRGIVNREEGQLIFVDTPGRHSSEKKMNKKLMEVSDRSLADSDLVLYVIDASRAPGEEEEEIVRLFKPLTDKLIIAINKIDLPSIDTTKLYEFLEKNILPLSSSSSASQREKIQNPVFPISANTGEGVDALLCVLFAMAPEGEPLYGDEYYTDQETGFRIAEIIREQAINRLRQELPHSLYVDIADMEFKETENQNGTLWVRAFIIVERESQKGMVVGKGGEMIKNIRLAALKELKKIFDWKIDLDLRVKTGKDWRHNDYTLKRLIN
ncbi:MAG: GTPase Era [Treponema sp.]|nr:GTPase Era [Treponema sp.]